VQLRDVGCNLLSTQIGDLKSKPRFDDPACASGQSCRAPGVDIPSHATACQQDIAVRFIACGRPLERLVHARYVTVHYDVM